MKKINMLFISLLLVGCNDKTSSSLRYSGTWTDISAPTLIATNGSRPNPFNTLMSLKYFVENSVNNKEVLIDEVGTLYKDGISDLHKKFDRHYSYYLDDNDREKGKYVNIKNVNDSLDKNLPVKLDKETYDLLKFGVEYTKYTDCYFNIFVGELTDFWDVIFNDAYNFGDASNDPMNNEKSKEEIDKLVKCIPQSAEEVDEVLKFNDSTYEVTFSSLKDGLGNPLGNISISVGGIAKGYATDIVKKRLIDNGYDKGYLFSGSSSISSLSTPIFNNDKGQFLSVLDPRTAKIFNGAEAAFGIYLKDEFSMSTSGNYISGKSYRIKNTETDEYVTRHHIINGFTGYPEYEEGIASVSIFSKTLGAGILDAFSTALVNKSVVEGLKFREKVINDYKCDLEIVYIKENIKNDTIHVMTTSDFNGTFEEMDSKGITYEYNIK